MDDRARPENVALMVDMLVVALADRGLSAERLGASMVWVSNRAADPPGSDQRAWRMSPGLRQVVRCHMDDIGDLAWYWVWHMPGAMPTNEWFAPAADIATAAEKIGRVLALRPEAVS